MKSFKGKKASLPKPLLKLTKSLIGRKASLLKNLTDEEAEILKKINTKTLERNRNNLTRTKAYLEFYLRHREVHWSFLGHMVSRNGGWNMTDLKGSLLTRLLTEREARDFFSFLERGNWLIFQDAYPQFLLYEESLRKGQNLFYLIPHLGVSFFMQSVWNYFWDERDSYVLTVALIINEQSYLEKRVIQNPFFQKKVLETWEFRFQDYFAMNHVLFPYDEDGKVKLAGLSLRRFDSLHERILFGKRLYRLLFNNKRRFHQTLNWARKTIHTGSRKDYWPHVFNDIEEAIPGSPLKQRLKSCRILPGYPRFYSPQLPFAWKDIEHEKAEKGDWYQRWQVIYYLLKTQENVSGEIENEYCKTLERLERAAITKKALFGTDKQK